VPCLGTDFAIDNVCRLQGGYLFVTHGGGQDRGPGPIPLIKSQKERKNWPFILTIYCIAFRKLKKIIFMQFSPLAELHFVISNLSVLIFGQIHKPVDCFEHNYVRNSWRQINRA
jgi:hypothetical protein